MRRLATGVFALALLVCAPAAAFAQASIVGLVKDASGAVLPGVTVEAASPVLIEKVRSVATDGTGHYRIESRRPGTYTVTFTLRASPRSSAKASSSPEHSSRRSIPTCGSARSPKPSPSAERRRSSTSRARRDSASWIERSSWRDPPS
jgi:carboxypeptidase family protein